MPSTLGQRFFNRVGHLEIEDFGALPEGLDIKFDVRKYGNFNVQFSAGVLGLSSDHINELTVWNPVDALKNSREIKVFAGYESDKQKSPIARGFIFKAMPTPPPDMWINFECMISIKNKIPIEEEEHMRNVEIIKVAEKICRLNGYKFIWKSAISKSARVNFMVSGSADGLIKNFERAFNVVAVLGDEDDISFYDNKAWNRFEVPNNISTVINTETGLLMVGNVDMAGATVRTRLNDRYQLFDWVRLESSLIPKANGNYFVLSKRHVGHLRGNEWYTELQMLRRG